VSEDNASNRRSRGRFEDADDYTVLNHQAITASNPGSSAWSTRESMIALPPGTRLFEYEITGIVGQGGFGIVYHALDKVLQRRVAIKEYLPSGMAVRSEAGAVTLGSQRHASAFEAGLSSFVNEAKLLARFDHPSLVKVFRFWEANGTAYMVMPLYEGVTLKQHLQENRGQVSQRWLQSLLESLLDALEHLHRAHVYHRDIAPDNILILEDGRPLLLDLGAARQRIGEVTRAMTVIVKPGYAPIEQYAEDLSLEQGAWTDIYALSAVAYFAMTEVVPPPSVSRLVSDSLQSLQRLAPDGYKRAFLQAIDRGLSVRPEGRPQSIAEFRALLRQTQPPRDSNRSKAQSSQPLPWWYLVAAVALVVIIIAGVALWPRTPEPATPLANAPPPLPQQQAPAPPPRGPFAPQTALQEVLSGQTPGYRVVASAVKSRIAIDDPIQFEVHTARAGYLYLILLDTENKLYMLFPNGIDQNNRLAANEHAALPRTGWTLIATPPPGINRILAVVSDTPREFSGIGLIPAGNFYEVPLETARGLYSVHQHPWPFLAGQPVCGQANCEDAFGAAMFTVEVLAKGQR